MKLNNSIVNKLLNTARAKNYGEEIFKSMKRKLPM